MGQKITPNIWCNGNAKEMADFYVSAFGDGKIKHTMYYPKSKEEGLADFQVDLAGKELVIDFEVRGRQFSLINAGDTFKPNPSISFFIDFNPGEDEQAREHLAEMWQKLTDGGNVMMPLDKYPFSDYYGWVEDKFGVSWQIVPANMDELMKKPGAYANMMQMKKLVIADF